MKKALLLLLALGTGQLCLNAQITLSASSFPAAGTVYTSTLADTVGVSAGAGGANMTWNYSFLAATANTQVDSFLAPTSTAWSASFPTASIAIHEKAGSTNTMIYLENAGGNYSRVGNVTISTGQIVPYQNPALQYVFPVNFGDNHGDTFTSSYNSITSGRPINGFGITSGHVDGWGKLITPAGTYNDVLRISNVRDQYDTVALGGSSTVILHTLVTYTNWYQTNTFFPLLAITVTDVSASMPSFPSSHVKTVAYWTGTPSSTGISGIEQRQLALQVFPNPCTESTNIHYQLNSSTDVVFSICDLSGKIIRSEKTHVEAGEHDYNLTMADLSKGVYLVNISAEEKTSTQRIFVY
jgi:Secretion system C-terminal sorting domain